MRKKDYLHWRSTWLIKTPSEVLERWKKSKISKKKKNISKENHKKSKTKNYLKKKKIKKKNNTEKKKKKKNNKYTEVNLSKKFSY